MKLRIYGNSLRLRLSRTDMQMFARSGSIQDAVQFVFDSPLSYTLESTSSVEEVQARYEDRIIRFLVPIKIARQWISSDRVGISFARPGGPSLLIEKDFRCLHREPGEEYDDADEFPNPLEFSGRELPAGQRTFGADADRQSINTIPMQVSPSVIDEGRSELLAL